LGVVGGHQSLYRLVVVERITVHGVFGNGATTKLRTKKKTQRKITTTTTTTTIKHATPSG
jgi:hypothetical protein